MRKITEIIEVLPTIITNGPGGASISILKDIGLDENEINEVLDIVGQGIARSELYTAGMKAEQFTSYLDDNPIFQQAIALASSSEVEFKTDNSGLHPALKRAFENHTIEELDFEKSLTSFDNPENENRADDLYDLIEYEYPNIAELVERALFDQDEMVQLIAIQGVTQNNLTVSLTQKLLQLFENTNNDTFISNLTQIFSDCSIKEALPLVLNKLKSENLMIVNDCIICLGTIGDANVIDTLLPFTKVDKIAASYDEEGFINCETDHTISEITKKTILKLKKV